MVLLASFPVTLTTPPTRNSKLIGSPRGLRVLFKGFNVIEIITGDAKDSTCNVGGNYKLTGFFGLKKGAILYLFFPGLGVELNMICP